MTELRHEIDARGVATLTLARSEKHNALSASLIDALHQAAIRLGQDDNVRAVILAADGKSFCAGGDLGWMREQMDADQATRRNAAEALANMLGALNALPKPLIARVQGNAFGGGVGMMAVCDAVVAVPEARFGLTETKLGLIPATIGPYVLARIGEAWARRYFMSARLFDAETAQRMQLVSEIVAPEVLDAAVEAEISPYLACAPGAVAAAKRLARRLGPVIDAATVADSIEALVGQWAGTEAPEGIAAFFERRKPAWDRLG